MPTDPIESPEAFAAGAEAPMLPSPATVTPAAILARGPCKPSASTGHATRADQLAALCKRYRRETWSALEILSLDEVTGERARLLRQATVLRETQGRRAEGWEAMTSVEPPKGESK